MKKKKSLYSIGIALVTLLLIAMPFTPFTASPKDPVEEFIGDLKNADAFVMDLPVGTDCEPKQILVNGSKPVKGPWIGTFLVSGGKGTLTLIYQEDGGLCREFIQNVPIEEANVIVGSIEEIGVVVIPAETLFQDVNHFCRYLTWVVTDWDLEVPDECKT